jgi:hypothetical protein
MHDYKKRYLELFNEITDVMEQLAKIQQKAELKIIADESNNMEENIAECG